MSSYPVSVERTTMPRQLGIIADRLRAVAEVLHRFEVAAMPALERLFIIETNLARMEALVESLDRKLDLLVPQPRWEKFSPEEAGRP